MSPQATKLRLLYERAERAFRIAKADKERAWLAYIKQMRAEGFCPNCEKPLPECKCVAMATEGYDVPSAPYIVGQHTHVCVVPASIAERIRGKLPESEGQSSEAITSTETSGFPARQSGSPEVDPSGERQKYLRCELVFKGKDCKYTGPVQTCDKTYENCRTMFNLTNFRGMPISLPHEEREDFPGLTIQIPMPPVKPPRKDDL